MKRLITKLTLQTNRCKWPTELCPNVVETNAEGLRTLSTTRTNSGQYHLHSNAALDREIIYENMLNNQQLRHYAPVINSSNAEGSSMYDTTPQCWNCKKSGDYILEALICENCGCLQDLNTHINYFELMNLPQTFKLPTDRLSKRFHHLQTVVHPDKYTNKSAREQNNSANWSSFINKAYRTLLIPIERGEYLLKLFGQRLPEDDAIIDKKFLMQMLERNEEVEEANSLSHLQQLSKDITKELQDYVLHLNNAFSDKDLLTFKMLLMKMRYLISLEQNIKTKSQSLDDGGT